MLRYVCSLFFAIILLFPAAVFAQISDPVELSLSTNEHSYNSGDIVEISGYIINVPENALVTISLYYDSTEILTQDVSIDPDGRYEMSVDTSGSPWTENSGTYDVIATYDDVQATVSFTLDETPPETVEIDNPDNIPEWIISNFCWWADGLVSDEDFISGLQWMIAEGYLTGDASSLDGATIPAELRGMVGDWCNGTLNYESIRTAFQNLIDAGGSKSDSISSELSSDTIPPQILQPTDIVSDAQDENGAIVTFDVLAIDDTDELVVPSCNPSSGMTFPVGTTSVTCNATDSAGNTAQPVSFSVIVNPPSVIVPNYVKEVAEFWCDDKISDSAYLDGIQYLIDNGIIVVTSTSTISGEDRSVPDWVKNTTCWWSDGLIDDETFLVGIEYLVNEGVIQV